MSKTEVKTYDGTVVRTITDHANIAQALVAFQAEMPTVHKGKTADTGKYRYQYADLADVMAAALPLLGKNGLSFTCRPKWTPDGYELVGVLMHVSGEKVKGGLPLFGRDSQSIGSAITYARRYLLGCLTGIVTDDDNDAQGVGAARAQAQRPPQADPVTGEVVDQAAELYAAIDATDDLEELRAIYNRFGVGNAPQEVRDRFAARVEAVKAVAKEPEAEATE